MADGTFDTIYAKNIIVTPDPGGVTDAIKIVQPDAAWGNPSPPSPPPNTAAQFLRAVDSEGEDKFRVDALGGTGISGGLHLTPGTNAEGQYQPTQGLWYDPKTDCYGAIIANPPLLDDTGTPIPWTRDYVLVSDVRVTPVRTTARLNGKLGVWTSLLNRAPVATELMKGEIVPWGDPVSGVLNVTMKKNDGTLVTRTL